MTSSQSLSDDSQLDALARWRTRPHHIPPESLGGRAIVWERMTDAERAAWHEAWGTPRWLASIAASNPGGSVGGSYTGIR